MKWVGIGLMGLGAWAMIGVWRQGLMVDAFMLAVVLFGVGVTMVVEDRA